MNPYLRSIYPQVREIEASAEKGSTIDPLVIATIHSRLLLMGGAVGMKVILLKAGGDVCSAHWKSSVVDVLSRAVRMYKDAIRLTIAPQSSLLCSNLAAALLNQFEQKGDINDLEESLQYHQQALELELAPDLDKSISLGNLALALQTQFEQKGDLEEFIQYHWQALELTPKPYPMSLHGLANELQIQFEQKRDLNNLKESIQYCQRALELIPALHPSRSISLNNLANALGARWRPQ